MKQAVLRLVLVAGWSTSSTLPAPPLLTTAGDERGIVSGARAQLTWGTHYDPAYFKISYPKGDLPRNVGVCTDVVIRALRHAGLDLQQAIHEDMLRAWAKYPRYRGLPAPDPSIDHRRVPNQRVYFRRHWKVLTNKAHDPADWRSGDVVEWTLFGGRDHTGVLSDRKDAEGFPFVIHNIGAGPQEEDVLRTPLWRIVGHFRRPSKRDQLRRP